MPILFKRRTYVSEFSSGFGYSTVSPIQQLITGLHVDGVWPLLDRLWVFAQPTEAQALKDLVAGAVATAVASPTFTANRGYTSDGATSYIDTNFDLATASAYTLNSAHMSVYTEVTAGGAPTGIGVFNAGKGTYLVPTSGTGSHVINDGGPNLGVNVIDGMAIITRTASNVRTVYSNGSSAGGDATASTAIATGFDVFVLALNNAGAAINFAPVGKSMRAASIGGGLDVTQAANLSARINTYMTVVGANLY